MAAPKLKLTKADKAQLVGFYKNAVERILASIDANVWKNPSNTRLALLLEDTRAEIKKLDASAVKWVDAKVASVYGGNIDFVNGKLKTIVPTPKGGMKAPIHRAAIQDLILNPTTGITPRLLAASSQLGQSIETFVSQNKLLKKQVEMVSGDLASGMLMGQSAATTRNQILTSLLGAKPGTFMGLDPAMGGAKSLIDAPYLKIPLKNGGTRRMHIFDHVQMTATTMENKVRTEARKNQMLASNVRLAQISPHPPLTECACAIFAGRIVSLDAQSEQASGYPFVGRLPGGGPPFHPYCTHTLLPWIPDVADPQDVAEAHANPTGTPTFGGNGIPESLLDSDWSNATKYIKGKGGLAWSVQQNPALLRYGPSSFAQGNVSKILSQPMPKIPMKVPAAVPSTVTPKIDPKKIVPKPTAIPASEVVTTPKPLPEPVPSVSPVPVKPKPPKAAPKAVEATPKPPPPPPPIDRSNGVWLDDGLLGASEMQTEAKFIKRLGGSNGAGLYEIGDEKWVIKGVQSDEHFGNELLANRLYRALGNDAPEMFGARMNGKRAIASRYLGDDVVELNQLTDEQKEQATKYIRAHFADDAFLSNWDVIGLAEDNMMVRLVDGNVQTVYKIDPGGSLYFRAQGAPKGAGWNGDLSEIDTFRNPQLAPEASRYFGGMSDQQIMDSLEDLASRLGKLDLDEIAGGLPLPPNVIDTLKARSLVVKDRIAALNAKIIEEKKLADLSKQQVEKAKVSLKANARTDWYDLTPESLTKRPTLPTPDWAKVVADDPDDVASVIKAFTGSYSGEIRSLRFFSTDDLINSFRRDWPEGLDEVDKVRRNGALTVVRMLMKEHLRSMSRTLKDADQSDIKAWAWMMKDKEVSEAVSEIFEEFLTRLKKIADAEPTFAINPSSGQTLHRANKLKAANLKLRKLDPDSAEWKATQAEAEAILYKAEKEGEVTLIRGLEEHMFRNGKIAFGVSKKVEANDFHPMFARLLDKVKRRMADVEDLVQTAGQTDYSKLYRGVDMDAEQLARVSQLVEEGDTLRFDTLTSFSSNTTNDFYTGSNVRFILKDAEGVGADMLKTKLSTYDNEGEVMLSRQLLRVTGIEKGGKNRLGQDAITYTLEVVDGKDGLVDTLWWESDLFVKGQSERIRAARAALKKGGE